MAIEPFFFFFFGSVNCNIIRLHGNIATSLNYNGKNSKGDHNNNNNKWNCIHKSGACHA